MANSSINFTELDFLALKNSVVNHLKSQPLFKDYDFTGSNINVLIDLLTKNTERNSFYYNMMMSEAFLDSAQMKSSVFSRAKGLNYTPRSMRSSKAKIQVTFNATGVSQPYIIQKGESFNTLIKNQAYVFSIPETITVASANTTFSFQTDVYEGIYVKDAYVFNADDLNPYPTFVITNDNVDTTSLTVAVYEDGATVADTYKPATTLLGLNDKSKVYFLQTSVEGKFEIYFGDGTTGYVPKNGSTIVLDYRVTNGAPANGASIFSINFDPTGAETELISSGNNPSITTILPGDGGASAESIESVRYYAPRAFQAQERAVTPLDYKILLQTNFPEISAVDVYGGDEETPPLFGKVIVSVEISNVDGLPDSKKQEYYTFLKERCPLTIVPIFKDPLFTYIHIDSLVRYNVNVTPASKERIKTLVLDAINTYNATNLDDFSVTLRYSNLVKSIDGCDDSIISNITGISLYKKLTPQLAVPQNMVVDFGTTLATSPIEEGTSFADSIIYSSPFTYKGESVLIKDNGSGEVFIVRQVAGVFSPIVQVGVVDYTLGTVSLTNFNPDNYEGNFFKIYAKPADLDVQAARRNIMTIEADEINVQVEPLRI